MALWREQVRAVVMGLMASAVAVPRTFDPRTAPRVALPMALILFQNIDDGGYDLRV
jgi:hypothetical protein